LKVIGLIISVLTGAFLIYASIDFPPWADPQSPASTHVSPHYIEKTIKETSVPNIVTAVLADYRGYDTMFETTVIFAFKSKPEESEQRLYRHLPSGITIRIKKGAKDPPDLAEFERIDSNWTPHDLIIKTTCRLLIPFIQLFALYVIAHGHHSPGGGFQGGVILGASIILLAIAYDMRTALSRMHEKVHALLCAFGVLIYAGTGTV